MMYCPKCGQTIFLKKDKNICSHCQTEAVSSLHDDQYYEQQSLQQYGKNYLYDKVLFEEEIKCNPLFDEETYKNRLNELYEIRQSNLTDNTHQPKCPMCGSTNIHKISGVKRATHGLAFGLFSKTARSQWECGNCHNKW